ncbi:HNH endonuclease, partial [Loigolactobacillus coryniformis]|uniref:HNH endonuclease n=1 Tax=Loigolactobacillus coryniformis TaxID=1610 RepID=UPI00201A6125
NWRKNNKEKVLFTRKKSQLKRRSLLTGDFTIEDWEYIKNINNYSCKLCSRKEPEIKLTVDHIIPISKNGKHTRENIQP